MLTRLSRSLIALAVCCSIGGHWIGLQSIAWASMIVNYSQQCSIAQAIEHTFDGEHPCNLCKNISKARDNEKKPDSQSSVGKTDLICTIRYVDLLPRSLDLNYPELVSAVRAGFGLTPYPPPRVELA
jgi:hypothetical protein